MAPNFKAKFIIIVIFTCFYDVTSEITPIVLWHGMGKIFKIINFKLEKLINRYFLYFFRR